MKKYPVHRVFRRECRRLINAPRYLILLTLGAVLTFVIFATMTNKGQPQRLPVGVVDLDGSYLSRRICHELDATSGVKVHAVYNNHMEARRAMQRGEIYAFYEIPAGTYNNVLQFKAPHFVLYNNAAYLLAGTQPLVINGKPFSDTFWLRTSDMFINTSVVLILIAIIGAAIGYSGIMRKMNNHKS